MKRLRELLAERRTLERLPMTSSVQRQLDGIAQKMQRLHDERFGIERGDSITAPGLTIEGASRTIGADPKRIGITPAVRKM